MKENLIEQMGLLKIYDSGYFIKSPEPELKPKKKKKKNFTFLALDESMMPQHM